MAYATATELSDYVGANRYLALTDRNADASADAAAVTLALDTASGVADTYIARYLPISTTPDALKRIVFDLAIYDLAGNHATDDEREKARIARELLVHIARGVANLALPDGSTSVAESAYATLDGPEGEFSRDLTGAI